MASRQSPLDGSTGASVPSELPQHSDEEPSNTSRPGDIYSIHKPCSRTNTGAISFENDRNLTSLFPSKGFGLKKELWQENVLLARPTILVVSEWLIMKT